MSFKGVNVNTGKSGCRAQEGYKISEVLYSSVSLVACTSLFKIMLTPADATASPKLVCR